jgi:hypothetical protein
MFNCDYDSKFIIGIDIANSPVDTNKLISVLKNLKKTIRTPKKNYFKCRFNFHQLKCIKIP